MQKKSSSSAVIKLPDRETLIQNLKGEADQLIKDFPEVMEIILFGSLARGDYGVYSDADLLIILDNSPYSRYFDRIPEYTLALSGFEMPVEVFPYTREEVNYMLQNGNLFIISIFKEGISLIKR